MGDPFPFASAGDGSGTQDRSSNRQRDECRRHHWRRVDGSPVSAYLTDIGHLVAEGPGGREVAVTGSSDRSTAP